MGIRAIEYRPWKGDRTNPNERWTVIAKQVFSKNVKAKAVLILLIFGLMLAHAFPIIGAILIPHEDINNEDMVGSEEEDEGPAYTINVTEGDVNVSENIRINGTFYINGTISLNYLYLPLKENETEENRTERQEELNRTLGSGLLSMNGTLFGLGSISGAGGFTSHLGLVYTNNTTVVKGTLLVGQVPELPTDVGNNPTGPGPGDQPPGSVGEFEDILEMMSLLNFATTVLGDVNITGNGTISGNGTVEGWVETEDDTGFDLTGPSGTGYLTNGLIVIFTMLLAAIICADVVASDLADSSFVLYFSRPVRAFDYLLGKITGLMWVLWLFCLIPPVAYVLVMMGTMTGDDWSGAGKILGKTVLAGLVTAVYFLPYGLMISSVTKSKAYAGIGIFMSFFVLSIVAGIFRESSEKWTLIDPFELLHNFYNILFNRALPEGISAGEVGGAILAFTVIPMSLVVYWIYRKGVGK